jgi:hypothetical protein
MEGNRERGEFGYSVATAGDVNGDGYEDVIIGAWQYSNGQVREGAAFVYLGSAVGLSTAPNWTGEGNQSTAAYGASVRTAGDVNGDGFDDIVVGAPNYHGGGEGRAYLYLGSDTGVSSDPSWVVSGNGDGVFFGGDVGTAGDVNGDGYDDVIVGDPYYNHELVEEGRAFLYLGSASGLSRTPSWIAEGNQTHADLGSSVGTAGDVNGDGYADVIVGAPYFDDGQIDEGAAFVYLGSASGLSPDPAWTGEADQRTSLYGNSAGTAGDVNGDGFDDIVVGAAFWDHLPADEGRAFVYLGSASGLSEAAIWSAESNQTGSYFGISVGTAGDVNGDGFDDVIVGAPTFDHGQTDEGRSFVYGGSASGVSSNPMWKGEGNQQGADFGNSVASAGDVNGDGLDEIIVGARLYDHGEENEGRVTVLSPGGVAKPTPRF